MIAGFAKLRADLTQTTDLEEIDTDTIFAPFLEVISSQSTTGPITFIALSSINKFLDYNVVSPTSKNIQLVISQLAFSITHCRFEATDQAEDDAVLLKILNIMELLVCGFGNDYLNDESLCDIIETCLSMACQMKRGDLLRRSAEMTMIKLTEAIFSRLYQIEPKDLSELDGLTGLHDHLSNPPPQVSEPVDDESESLGVATIDNNDSITIKDTAQDSSGSTEIVDVEITSANNVHHQNEIVSSNAGDNGAFDQQPLSRTPTNTDQKPFQKYGIPAIREYLRVLISIIDSSNAHQYTDATRIMVLHLINVAFEVAGTQITRFPTLLDLTTTTLLKHLLQLIRSDNPFLLQKALRVSSTISHTSREHLKLQQELFLTYLLTCLSPISDIPREEGVDDIFYNGVPSVPRTVLSASPHPSKVPTPVGGKPAAAGGGASSSSDGPSIPSFINTRSPDAREMMVEALTGLTRIPSYFVDLYVNYDCDVDRADLCEDLVGFLCRNAYPDSATWSTSSVPPLCLDALLAFLSSLVSRLDGGVNTTGTKRQVNDVDDKKLAETAAKNKTLKKLIIKATDLFNLKPAKGIDMMEKTGIIPDKEPTTVVDFLKRSGRINKKVLGEFLSAHQNTKYLNPFIEEFDFENKSLDEALRDLCTAIRLPGESQLIERIMEKFAEHFCEFKSNTRNVADKDAAFVLSYAVIMLNTDLHNPIIKNHMTNEQFKRNLRKMNANEDFAPEYLDLIYETIRDREIVMPEEHDNEESFEHIWRSLLLKAPSAGEAVICHTGIFDKELFEVSWQPIVSTLSYIFATATEDTVFSRVITGFDQLAKIANKFNIPGVADQIVYSLGKISTLTYGDLSSPTSTIEMKVEENESIVVSDLSIQFGEDFKAQLASIVLFRIAKSSNLSISDTWSQIIRLITNLYLHSLFEPHYSSTQDQFGIPSLPFVKPVHSLRKSKSSKDVGLFSTLSSYLTGYGDSISEPTDEEIENTLCTIDCVNSLDIREFLDESSKSIPLDIVDAVTSILPSLNGLSPTNRHKYYPAILFLLELASVAAINSSDVSVKRKVVQMIKKHVSEWEIDDKDFLTRCLVYYIIVLRYSSIELEPELIDALKRISRIKDVVLLPCISHLIQPLILLSEEGAWSYETVLKKSEEYWQLFRLAASNRDSASAAFDYVQSLVQESSLPKKNLVDADNIVSILNVYGEIVSIGACGAQLEQDKTAIAYEFRKQYDQQTAIKKAKEVIANMELDVKRSVSALDTLSSIGSLIAKIADDKNNKSAWGDIWFPYIRILSQQCINPSRKIRHQAFHIFQRVCLSPIPQARPDFDWGVMFDDELFPFLEVLLKAEVFETDPKGMLYTRLQAASLLCKVFLQYVASQQVSSTEGKNSELFNFWIRVLDTLDRLINSTPSSRRSSEENSRYNGSGHGGSSNNGNISGNGSGKSGSGETLTALEEGVVESIKNLLLVMKTSEPPQDSHFWTETWKRVDSIMPGLKEELNEKVEGRSVVPAGEKLSETSHK